jgi:hypothetical protein
VTITPATNSLFTAGPITWSPTVPSAGFATNTTYTATVTLTATTGEAVFAGIDDVTVNPSGSGDNGSVSSTEVKTDSSTLTLKYTFKNTQPPKEVESIEVVTLLDAPLKLEYTHGDRIELANLAVELSYNEGYEPDTVKFSNFSSYKLSIKLSDETKTTTSVNGNSSIDYSIHNGNSIVITYNNDPEITTSTGSFIVKAAAITNASIIVTTPETGKKPSSAVVSFSASPSQSFTIDTLTWNIHQDSSFKADEDYIATVLLKNRPGFEFTNAFSADINGGSVLPQDIFPMAGSMRISYTFKPMANFAIISEPKLTYAHGDKLDLSSMEIEITYADSTRDTVKSTKFTARGFTINPAEGSTLTESHDGSRISVSYNGKQVAQTTGTLKVTKASITEIAILIPAPVTGTVPSSKATKDKDGNFSIGTVNWNPVDIVFMDNKQYTATVILTVNDGNLFADSISATINGKDAIIGQNNGNSITLSYKFLNISSEAVVVIVGDAVLTPDSARNISYTAQCEVKAETVTVPGTNSVIKPLEYGENKMDIFIAEQLYTLTIHKPIPAKDMIKEMWGTTLVLVNNSRYTDYDYDPASYVWYKNGREVGRGQYWSVGTSGGKIHPDDKFRVEAKTTTGEVVKSCEEQYTVEPPTYGIMLKNNSMGTIDFEMITPEHTETDIFIYNISGNLVAKLKGNSVKGIANNIPNGMYFITAKSKGQSGKIYRYSTKLVVKK